MIGPVQARVLIRAGESKVGYVMPAGHLERRALRRLERRGIVATVPGLPNVWRVK